MTTLKFIYNFFEKYPIISTDTRKIEKNSIFFALKGSNFNANKFAEEALKKGAKYVVIDDKEFKKDDRYILVDNTLECLQKLANYHRKQFSYPIIGITGTNGKTTTKELIYNVLSYKYKVKSTIGNFNNHIGVPLTLLSFPKDLDFGIVEMGANHPGEIADLCKIAEPDYGIITNIGKAHIEGFGSFEGVINTKNELYDFIKSKNGTIIYNADNKILKSLIGDYKNTVAFDLNFNEKYSGKIKELNPFVKFTFKNNGQLIDIQSNLVGDYNIENLVAAATFGSLFKLNNNEIKNAIESYTPDNKRSQLLKTNKNTLIVDAYNANATSMQKAIDNFSNLTLNNKVLILGDMLELGDESEKEHLNILNKIKDIKIKSIYLVGNEFFKFKDKFNFSFFKNSDELKSYFENNPIKNANVLLKASRGIRLEKVIDAL